MSLQSQILSIYTLSQLSQLVRSQGSVDLLAYYIWDCDGFYSNYTQDDVQCALKGILGC